MKLAITKINEIDNIIYNYVYYTENQLIEKYKKIHKEKFSKVLEELSSSKFRILIILRSNSLRIRQIIRSFRLRTPTRRLQNLILRIFPLEQPRIRFHNINLQQQQQEEQEQKEKKNNNINKYISISKVKYYKNINYRKKYKNPRKSYKPVGGKCVRFKYI